MKIASRGRDTRSLYTTKFNANILMKLFFKNYSFALLLALLFVSSSASAQFWTKKKTDLLAETDAFAMTALIDGDQLRIQWTIADGYYMYRDQFGLQSSTPGAEFGDLVFPEGVIEQDPEFGEVTVYFYTAEITAPIHSLPTSGNEIELTVLGQGCNKPVGVCYPPQTRSIKVDFTPSTVTSSTAPPIASEPINVNSSEAGFSAANNTDQNKSFWAYVIGAFAVGLLLSFTPCVLPMIPILMAIIAGQNKPSRMTSGLLALCYSAGHIFVYAIAGWIIALGGGQIQAYFQNPYMIGGLCIILVILAISLFGAFKIQLPASLQTKLSSAQFNSRSLFITSFVLGAISSLIIGACVSPLLIGVIGGIAATGNPLIGASVMASLALGMDALLIALGFGAGWLLPKAGAWMNHVQVILGFLVLSAAIFIAGFIDLVPVLYFWAGLFIWFGYYLLSMSGSINSDVIKTLFKALSTVFIIWGAVSLLGAFTGGKDIAQPLDSVSFGGASKSSINKKLPFNIVTNVAQAKQFLKEAKASKQPVLVDFYADWCTDCKRMDRTTFAQSDVHNALNDWALLKADVTETNSNSEALKQFFDVFGPPATLFIRGDGSEHQNLRQYGYMKKEDFLAILAQAKP